MENNEGVMSNNPYDPKSYNPNPFSKEWRKHNPWMEEIDDGYNDFDKTIKELRDSLDKIKKENEPKKSKRVGICINFGEGIPLDYFIEKESEKVALIKQKASDLAVFNEMMRESKGISRVVRSYNK